LDVTDENTFIDLKKEISNKEIYSIINCAGGTTASPQKNILDNTDKDFISSFYLNSIGPFLLVKNVLPNMKKELNPIIINITSILAHKILSDSAPYNISKKSLSMMSKFMRRDLAHLNIRCTEIILSSVNTKNNFGYKNKSMNTQSVSEIIKFILDCDVNIDYIAASHVKEVIV
jgi:short-subunit dehydrogenase